MEPNHGLVRLVSFGDAVVAIAITLIVLPLVDSAREIGSRPVGAFLAANAENIFAAALSFAVIASYWKDHHHLYEDVTKSTPSLINANLVWLAGIVFLPLPTVLVVESHNDRVASALYVGTIFVSAGALRIQELIIVHSHLLEDGREPLPRHLWADWIVMILLATAFVLTATIPGLGLYPLLLVLLSRPVNWLSRRGAPPDTRRQRIL
jgi:uncharacterized membrane protein